MEKKDLKKETFNILPLMVFNVNEKRNMLISILAVLIIIFSILSIYSEYNEYAGNDMYTQETYGITILNKTNFANSSELTNSGKNAYPMGIVDQGREIVKSKNGNMIEYYKYNTTELLGNVTIYSLKTNNATDEQYIGTWVSIQLNAVLVFNVTENGNEKQEIYWVQDVAMLNTTGNYVFFVDNIWMFPPQVLEKGNLTGNGYMAYAPIKNYSGMFYSCNAYTDMPGNYISLNYPATIQLFISSTEVNSKPEINFYYDDGFGMQCFDTVTFNAQATKDYGFVVNGLEKAPGNHMFDAELVFAGPWGGKNTTVYSANTTMQLQFWNGHNLQGIISAFNYGVNTAEGISGLDITAQEREGNIMVAGKQGKENCTELFSSQDTGNLLIESGAPFGTVEINNESYDFSNGLANITLFSGNYTAKVTLIDNQTKNVNVEIFPGNITVIKIAYNMPNRPFITLSLLITGITTGVAVIFVWKNKNH